MPKNLFRKEFWLPSAAATGLLLAITPEISCAAENVAYTAENALDTIWVILAAVLVFFMQAGFAMVEAGFTRAKNTGNIVMKNLMDYVFGTIVYWLFGFALMFGLSKSGLVGTSGFLMNSQFEHLGLKIPLYAFILFQTVFCATAATIVSGAMAERTKFSAYLVYSIVISSFVYPIAGHWIWGGGWLSKLGFIDFAGSTVVHSIGGLSALIGAAIVGPRIGKYGQDGSVHIIPGHNILIGALGVFILWFGWFGFNPGSTLSGMAPDIGYIAVTTNLSAAAGAAAAMISAWVKYGKPDVSLTLNGALGGLVGITAGTAAVTPTGSLVIGILCGVLVVVAVEFIDRVLKIDDPVGAISVHFVCGVFGTLMVGFFAREGGLFYGGGIEQLVIQVLGVLSVLAWTGGTMFIVFKIIKGAIGLRVSEKEEIEGLDAGEHGMVAYPEFAANMPISLNENIFPEQPALMQGASVETQPLKS